MTSLCLYFFRFSTCWYVVRTWNWDLSQILFGQKFPKAAIVETSYHSWSFILIVHRLHGRLVVPSLGRSCSLCNAFKSHRSCGNSGKVFIYSCYILYKQTGTDKETVSSVPIRVAAFINQLYSRITVLKNIHTPIYGNVVMRPSDKWRILYLKLERQAH